MHIRTYFLFFAITLLMLSNRAFSSEILVIGVYNLPGFMDVQQGESGGKGELIDRLKEVADLAGIKFEFRGFPAAPAKALVASEKNFCSPMGKVDTNNSLKWAGPFARYNWSIYSLENKPGPFTDLESLRGKSVGVLRDSPIAEYLKKKGFNVEMANDSTGNLRKLLAKRIDLWANNDLEMPFIIRDAGNPPIFRVLDFLHVEAFIACNASVSGETMSRLDDAINTVKKNGGLNKLGF